MNPRVEMLRERMLKSRPALDIQRARLITRAYQEAEGEPMVIIRGKAMNRLFSELPVHIAPHELIVGSPTREPRSAQIFPEVQAGWIDQELDLVNTREWDPLYLSEEDKRELRQEIIPFWRGKTISERVFRDCPAETARLIYQDPSVCF